MEKKPAVVYLRHKSPLAAHGDYTSPLRRGIPFGALAFLTTAIVMEGKPYTKVEFSYTMTHERHDSFNRKFARVEAVKRLNMKRLPKTLTKTEFVQVNAGDGTSDSELRQHYPRYFSFEIPTPEESLRPYDALETILVAAHTGKISIPPKLEKTIMTMLNDQVRRNERHDFLAGNGAIYAKIQELLTCEDATHDDIMNSLNGLRRVDGMARALVEVSADTTPEEDDTLLREVSF